MTVVTSGYIPPVCCSSWYTGTVQFPVRPLWPVTVPPWPDSDLAGRQPDYEFPSPHGTDQPETMETRDVIVTDRLHKNDCSIVILS